MNSGPRYDLNCIKEAVQANPRRRVQVGRRALADAAAVGISYEGICDHILLLSSEHYQQTKTYKDDEGNTQYKDVYFLPITIVEDNPALFYIKLHLTRKKAGAFFVYIDSFHPEGRFN